MNIVLWVAQILLAGLFGMAGFMKAFRTEQARGQMPWAKRHSNSFLRFIGLMELLGAFGIVLPMITGIMPWLTVIAAGGLVLVQALAIFAEHIPHQEFKGLPINVVLLALAVFVAVGRQGLI